MSKRNRSSEETPNIFTQIHTERNGTRTPIISMSAEHLVNYVNFMLNKKRISYIAEVKTDFLGDVAPEGMPENQRISLGLKKVTAEMVERAEAAVEQAQQSYMAGIIEHIWPYIIVGVCRDDTRDGVVKILQESTGVTSQIALPHLMGKTFSPLLVDGTSSNDWEILGDEFGEIF